jgi:hypothetical protein
MRILRSRIERISGREPCDGSGPFADCREGERGRLFSSALRKTLYESISVTKALVRARSCV